MTCSLCELLKLLPTLPTLTVGMAVYDDFDRAAMTLMGLRFGHAEIAANLELLVVDNNPMSRQGQRLRCLCGSIGATYIPYEEVQGTSAPRDLVFQKAKNEFVLCIDSHVILPPVTLLRLLKFAADNRDSKDLFHGPLILEHFKTQAINNPEVQCPHAYTHMNPVWGEDLMFGKWGCDQRGASADSEPFEIPMHGLGLFGCFKTAWLGFPTGLRGFGGEEGNIHEKYRQAGHKTWCLPFLRWWHLWNDEQKSPSYPALMLDKCRNYLIWALHLGKGDAGIEEIKSRFVRDPAGLKRGNYPISEGQFMNLAEDAKEVTGTACGTESGLEAVYRKACATPSDINEHLPLLRELASRCSRVTEFGVRSAVSTTALLAGQPDSLASYDIADSPECVGLKALEGATAFHFEIANSLQVDIEPTDMLFIDTVHTGEQLRAELARHHSKVTRWLVFHDTVAFGDVGEDGKPGLAHVINEFMEQHPEWFVYRDRINNNGLTVISKNPIDKNDADLETRPDMIELTEADIEPISETARPVVTTPQVNRLPIVPAKCQHINFNWQISTHRNENNGQPDWLARARATCSDCGMPMWFPELGPSGAKEARFAIAPMH